MRSVFAVLFEEVFQVLESSFSPISGKKNAPKGFAKEKRQGVGREQPQFLFLNGSTHVELL
jgi:hypothetical protein